MSADVRSTDPGFNEIPLEGTAEFQSRFMQAGNGRRLLVIEEVNKHGDGGDIRMYREEAEAIRDYLTKVLT